MAALFQTSGDISILKELFIPQEILDHPFDVTLVGRDGKEFKAHRRVLAEASSFFEKLLNSDMKESNEGIIHLEMLTELGLRDILEFIYTGGVQLSAADHARDMIEMADYLDLPHLKTIAGRVLVKDLNLDFSNFMSSYYFAENYRCEELISHTCNFIRANFATVAKTEDFLNLSSKAVNMCIASDELNVSAEDDVFKIILTWIDHDKSERKKYFAELFREVRLVYVSRDFLYSDIVTNDFVNNNQDSMDLVKVVMKYSFIGSIGYPQFRFKARNSLETPVFVITIPRKQHHLCYNIREDTWSQTTFRGRALLPMEDGEVFYSHDKFYFLSAPQSGARSLERYDSVLKCWTPLFLSVEQRRVDGIFVGNRDEIYALVTEWAHPYHDHYFGPCGERHLSLIMKYNSETNSWEDITSFDLDSRTSICIVAKGSFVYCLGGHLRYQNKTLTDAGRCDLNTNTWEKIADLQEPRRDAKGAAAHEKIFIVGGERSMSSCEVYNERTGEWQYIARLNKDKHNYLEALIPVDCKLYAFICEPSQQRLRIECYDAESNRWKELTRVSLGLPGMGPSNVSPKPRIRSMRVFKGCDFLQESLASSLDSNECKSKCSIV